MPRPATTRHPHLPRALHESPLTTPQNPLQGRLRRRSLLVVAAALLAATAIRAGRSSEDWDTTREGDSPAPQSWPISSPPPPAAPAANVSQVTLLTAALPDGAGIHIGEDWPLPDGGSALWGYWSHADRPADRAARGAGDVVLVSHDGRTGGIVTGLPQGDVLIAPAPGGRVRLTHVPASPKQPCDEEAAAGSVDHLWHLPATSLTARTAPLRALDVLVLYTPRALSHVGGRREHLKHCIDASLASASEAFGAPDSPTPAVFHRRALVPIPTDDRGQSLRDIWRRLREPTSPRFGRLAAALHRAVAPDIILLVAAPRGERCHGYASPARPGHAEPAFAVVPTNELRHGDLTVAHELGHCLGLRHTVPSHEPTVMTSGAKRRARRVGARPARHARAQTREASRGR